jgi:hypothetical protein
MTSAANSRPNLCSILSRIKADNYGIDLDQVDTEVSSNREAHSPRHRHDGYIKPCAGPNPWPRWREKKLVEQGCCLPDDSRLPQYAGLLFIALDAHATPLRTSLTRRGCSSSSAINLRISPTIETHPRIVADTQKLTISTVTFGVVLYLVFPFLADDLPISHELEFRKAQLGRGKEVQA